MTHRLFPWVMGGLAGALAVVAIVSGPNIIVAIPAATASVVVAVLVIVESMIGMEVTPREAAETVVSDAAYRLGGALDRGVLGREAVLETIQAISSELHSDVVRPLTSAEENAWLQVPDRQFLEALDEWTARTERET